MGPHPGSSPQAQLQDGVLSGVARTHLDPAVIAILRPGADDQLAVGFQGQVSHVIQKLLVGAMLICDAVKDTEGV